MGFRGQWVVTGRDIPLLCTAAVALSKNEPAVDSRGMDLVRFCARIVESFFLHSTECSAHSRAISVSFRLVSIFFCLLVFKGRGKGGDYFCF